MMSLNWNLNTILIHPNVLESHLKFICNYLIYSRSGGLLLDLKGFQWKLFQ